MKVPIAQKIVSLSLVLSVLLGNIGVVFSSYGQDGSPDLYLPERMEPSMEEDIMTEGDYDSYEDEFFQEEQQYYGEETIIEEDTSSVSMLTFNFLFYIVYKLKFSTGEQAEDNSKTADD